MYKYICFFRIVHLHTVVPIYAYKVVSICKVKVYRFMYPSLRCTTLIDWKMISSFVNTSCLFELCSFKDTRTNSI